MGNADGIHSAAEVEQLTPDQRQQLVNDQTDTELDQLPADVVAMARAEGRRLLVERGVVAE